MQNLSEMLKRIPLFAGLDADSIGYFLAHSRQRQYDKGEELFAMGDPADRLFLVVGGWVKLYRLSRAGEETIINIFAPGETFAEAAVFGPMQRYPVNAQAIEPTTLLEIPRKLFVDKIHEDSDFALLLLSSISARQRYLIQQIEQITIKTAPQRIGMFLLRLCPPGKTQNIDVNLPYDKFLIARRLNLEPETFSRSLKKLSAQGVTVTGHRITIHDVERLATFCDVEDRQSLC